MEQELLNVTEAANRLRLKPSTIRAWILNRRIQYVKLGGRVFIRKQDIDALIHGNLVPAESGLLAFRHGDA
jgi:excisionase family DNA binding protein